MKKVKILSSSEFGKEIKAKPCGAYLFFGEEDYLKSHALRAFKEAMGIDPALEIFNYIHLDMLDYTPDKLIDSLTPPPMMAEKKLVVVSGLDTTKLRSGEISELCDAISHVEEYDYNNFVLILPSDCLDEGYLPKRPSATFTSLSKHLTPVRFEQSSPQKLAAWSMKHFAHYGVDASPTDCAYLIEYCGKSMFLLANEIEKLAYYTKVHGRQRLAREDVPLVCSAEIEYDAFEFANAILADRRSDALSTLSAMKFKQVEPLNILSEMARVYCDLVSVKMLLFAGGGEEDVAAKLKMHEYKAKLYIRAAQNMELERMQALIKMCCEADAAMKLSDKTYLPLEKLICSI